MPDLLVQALGLPGLGWLILAALVAGTVRGFSGFGTAMIYLPVTAQFIPPLWAIITLIVMDIFGPIPNVPRALKDSHRRDLLLLLGGTLCLFPVGLMALSAVAPETYRYALSGLSLALVGCLVLGVRYTGSLRPPLIGTIGGVAGFTGGLTGVPGPPVILFYMASTLPVRVVRANVFLYLFFFDFIALAIIGLRGDLVAMPLLLGGCLVLPNLLGNVIGAAVFNPDKAGVYRAIAYVIVAVSAIMGLPLWD